MFESWYKSEWAVQKGGVVGREDTWSGDYGDDKVQEVSRGLGGWHWVDSIMDGGGVRTRNFPPRGQSDQRTVPVDIKTHQESWQV